VAAAAAVFLWLVFFLAGVFIFPFTAGTSGVFFDEAVRVASGQVMYRDFFEFVGPGAPHLGALALLLFGRGAAVLGWMGVALGCALALAVHALSSRLLPAGWRLLPPAAFLALVYAPYIFGDHKWPALLLAFAGLLKLSSARSAGEGGWAGLLLGASTLFTQDLGLGVCAGALVFLVARGGSRRLALAVAGGAAVLPLMALAFFAWKAGPATLLYDWIVFPLTRYRELNRFRLTARLSPRGLPRDLAQLVLTMAGVLGAIAELRSGRAGAAGAARLVSLAGLGAFLATAHRGWYPTGLAVQSAVLIPVAVRALRDRLALTPWSARLPAAAACALIAVGLVHAGPAFAVWRQFLQPLTLEHHRAGIVWTPRPMPELVWLEQRTAPGQAAFLLPARGGHYFLTRTRDVTAFPYLIEGQHTVEQARAALAQIDAARPAVGLWDQRPWPRSAPFEPGPLALLFEGLARGYDMERLDNGVFLLRRKAP